MSIGKQLSTLRKSQNMTQEEFGKIFHVTRQTVSNWENEKSYPDLQTLVELSDIFQISLDQLLKEDNKMIKTIDRERLYGSYVKRQFLIIDRLTGLGTGLLIGALLAPDSIPRTVEIIIGIVMINIGWYRKSKIDKKIIQYLDETDGEGENAEIVERNA